jgi:ferrochelatase
MPSATGVLLIQLGTPDAPTSAALRRYLRQFLGDPRVIESTFVRNVVVPLFVLPRRPARSAAKYARIWDPVTGSPLLHHTRRQAELLQAALPDVPVRFGMQIGNPPLADAVRELIAAGVEKLIAVPMYPQYSATTVASATDTLFKALMAERRVPAVRVVPPYYDHPAYLDALTADIRDELKSLPAEPEHFLLSFHGIPKSYATAGDPYATHCVRTACGLVERLGWPREKWTQSYQSLFGRDVWLKPYTDDVLTRLAKSGVRRVFVATPGFTADCLETIDEIGRESAEVFRHAGGEVLYRCRCLNDHPAWIAALKQIVTDEGRGWLGL